MTLLTAYSDQGGGFRRHYLKMTLVPRILVNENVVHITALWLFKTSINGEN